MPLVVDQIDKAFGGKQVFHGLSYTFPETGIVWIQGPSGRGKTTLLRMIAGLEKPDRGAVYLPENTRLSFVFQEDRLLPSITARDNVQAVLGRRTGETRALADRCLARCGLKGEEGRYPAQLSGGMRRRVAIARAMAYGGNLLLLDEPFRGLDRELRETVMDFVFAENNRLILLVTHDPEEAVRCTHTLDLG